MLHEGGPVPMAKFKVREVRTELLISILTFDP
jgi:hypothetical protein